MKKIVAVFLAVCMIELFALPAYALDLENNKYILASEYKSADSEVQKRIEQDCNSFSQMGLDKEWVRIVKIDGVDDREILYAVCSMDNTAYVTLSYHAGAIIANMSDPDGKTTELIYISPTNIWINGQRVAFEILQECIKDNIVQHHCMAVHLNILRTSITKKSRVLRFLIL